MNNKKTAIKVILLLVGCFILGMIIGEALNYYKRPKADFEIFQSIKSSFDNGESCHIKVIVRVKEYDIDEMCEQVKQHYYALNGEVDRLEMQLFNSKKDFDNYIVAGEHTFYSNDPDNIFLDD